MALEVSMPVLHKEHAGHRRRLVSVLDRTIFQLGVGTNWTWALSMADVVPGVHFGHDCCEYLEATLERQCRSPPSLLQYSAIELHSGPNQKLKGSRQGSDLVSQKW